ncbi:hypothetical protein [Pseudomonas graminis]|jgi:hypothetical protein|uniref:hypothetical protein n=1 Tax=Pseudomonas graminis TaxID=158627 RepID=UPI003C1CD5A4
MLRIASVFVFTAIFSLPASAQEQFQCAGATVTIAVDATRPLRSTEGADVVLRVERGTRSTVLRYSNVDFIGGECDTDANHASRIIYQAVCGGSGCHDLSNWGVINPESLQALLVPSDDSLEPAIALLGHKPMLKGKPMNVSAEAHRLGLPTP